VLEELELLAVITSPLSGSFVFAGLIILLLMLTIITSTFNIQKFLQDCKSVDIINIYIICLICFEGLWK
jgi:hypothetical protein